jgi:hypothetical protein
MLSFIIFFFFTLSSYLPLVFSEIIDRTVASSTPVACVDPNTPCIINLERLVHAMHVILIVVQMAIVPLI